MGTLESTAITIGATVFTLGVLIFFHELGHFLIAKRNGIRVDKFSLGFPPTILSKKVGETEYCIGLIPLGGFVKMAGENPDEEVTGAEDEFMSKSVGARAAVIFAGPFTNFLLAWILLWGVFFFKGEPYIDNESALLGRVSMDYPAGQAGIMKGDIVTGINGTPISLLGHLEEHVRTETERPVVVIWEREETTHTDTVLSEEYLMTTAIESNDEVISVDGKPFLKNDDYQMLVEMALNKSFEVTWERDGQQMTGTVTSPLDIPGQLGLIDGDQLQSAEGYGLAAFAHMAILISRQESKPITVDLVRGDQPLTFNLTTITEEYEVDGVVKTYGIMGVRAGKSYQPYGFFDASLRGMTRSAEFVKEVVFFIGRIFSMQESAKDIGGPVLIAQWAGQVARDGFADLLLFMALLSINLGVLNVLPIPVLDGGHLLFLAIEKIKGSALSMNHRMIAQQVGMVLLLGVILIVTYNDIARLITG